MQNPYKKITASLLLFSHMLTSCYNPNMGMGKQALPTPDPANKQRQYAGEPHDKYPPKPPSHTLTTADKHPVRFTYQNGQWLAEVEEYAAHGSCQRRQLPVVFEPGLALEDVVDSNPAEQKQVIHLCASEEEPDQPGYVYVGRGPMPQPRLLSSPAARQTTPPSAVGLSPQQARTQPQQGETSPQQAQEQPGRQAVLALPSPVQEIGEGPRSQDQLPTTPARVISKSLPAPSRETPSHRVAKKQAISPQRAPSRKALSWRNQHELLHSQRAAQAKRAQSAAMARPGNELAQPAEPSQAIVSLTPAHPPSLSDKAPPGIGSQNLLAQGGHPVRFMHRDGQWWASVREGIGVFSRVWVLPVACERHGDVAKALAELQAKPTQYTQRRIHVMYTKQIPYVPQFVYLGAQGLQGGGNGAGEASGSDEHMSDAPPGRQEDAQDREPSQSLVASQDREASLVALQARMAQGDITSTQGLVEALNAAQPAEQQALQQWIERYIDWFNEQTQHVRNLALIPEKIQEYTCLAHIQPNTEKNRRLLRSYFANLRNNIDEKYKDGEEPLLQALEYTLQTMDSAVFEGKPAPLIHLGNTLLAKLDSSSHEFTQATYPTHCGTLYALHQALVLIQQIAPGQLDPNQEEGLYSRFKAQIKAIAASSGYYPIRYHARLLKQSLQRLELRGYQVRLQGRLRRVGHGLKGALYLFQSARALATLDLDIDALLSSYESLQAAFTSQGIKAKPWYDWHQALSHFGLLSLEDPAKYRDFEECLQKLKAKEATMRKEKDRKALRFGIVMQLRMLSLHGPTAEVRKQSMEQLQALTNSWSEDAEVMAGLLDGLAALTIQSQGAEKEAAEAALASLTLTDSPLGTARRRFSPLSSDRRKAAALASITEQWLDGQTLADKLRDMRAPAAAPASGDLFSTIHSLLSAEAPVASPPPAAAEEARQALRAHYQELSFAQVLSLFEGEAPKHVDALQCQLMLIEPVKKPADREGPQDDVATHHERQGRVKKPIALEDLFKKRKTKPDGPEKEIQKVLLVGEPGTGKTTLTRKLAYRWTQGKWGEAFEAVYVLPVRALQQSQYDNVSLRREATLPTAIANNCFPRQNKDEEYERLRDQISEELEKPTTLVVLDGLDEGAGASDALLKQAKAGRHKLLLLSRPYGIEQERTLVDIEIAHAGLSDGQMQDYVRGNLSSELGEELLQFIKDYPAIASIAHVPVNLQILCALWKDDGAGVRAETSNGSLPGLYRMLTEYTCNRYEERQRNVHVAVPYTDREELFDKLGQVALKALEQGEVLISRGTVDQVLGVDAKLKAMLKDSGFLLFQALDSQEHQESQPSQYQFPHLTFQEYFAGRRLARQFLSGNAEDQAEVQDFFSEHQYEPQYGRMLSFFSGEVSKNKKGVHGISQVLSLLQAAPQEVVGVQHMLLQLRLLNEWLCVAGKQRQAGLDKLEGEFHVMDSLNGWFGEGLDRVRRGGYSGDNSKLLSLLTRGLQGSRAVAGQAPALLPPLIEAMRDSESYVRRAARSALGEVVQAAPGQALEVLPSLLEALRDSYYDVRCAASYALGEVVQAAPGQVLEVLPPLLEALRDSDYDVRCAASSALGQVVQAVPGQALEVLPLLLEAMRDKSEYVRRAARSALGQVVQAAPAEQVLPPLLEAMRNSDYDVHRAASYALGHVVQAAPEHAPALVEHLLAVYKDLSVRSAARSALAEVAKAAPAQVLKSLLAASKDSSSSVRYAARSALAEVAKAAPELAAQVLEPLLAACKNSSSFSFVRSAARSALAEVAKAAPELAAQVFEPLLAACKDSDSDVRRAASEALGQVVKAAPQNAEQVLPSLIEAMRDKSEYVRRAAIRDLGQVVKAAPQNAEQVLPSLIEAMRDKSEYVRRAAREALGEVIQAAPGQALEVLPPLIEAMRDSESYVRRAAIRALGEVVQAAPGQALEVLPPLLEAMRDSDCDVRRAASEALGEVVQAAPAEQVLPPLREAMRDNNWLVRRAAIRALREVVQAAPAEQVLPPLLDAMRDSDYDVRRAASEALGQVVQAVPGQALEVLPPLLEAMRDSESYVRRAASEALGEVVQAAPGQALEVLPPLREAMWDNNWLVCRAAIRALGEVVQAAPGQALEVLPPLLEAMWDSESYVHYAASDVLEQFSIEQFMDAYWATQNQALIPFIVTRLYHTPLVVRTSLEPHHQRLVLYPTAGKHVKWDKPHEEVQRFVQQIQSAAKQKR